MAQPMCSGVGSFGDRLWGVSGDRRHDGRLHLPGPTELAALVERSGSPLDDALSVRATAIPATILDRTFAELVAGSVTIARAAAQATSIPLDLVRPVDVTLGQAGACRAVTAHGPAPSVDLIAPSGGTLFVGSDTTGQAEVRISLKGTFESTGHTFEVLPQGSTAISLPDIGNGLDLRLRFLPPVDASTVLCAH